MSTVTQPSAMRTTGKYAAIGFYLIFALFPIYWLVKIALTPDALIYSEGTRMLPSTLTFENFAAVLQSEFLSYFANSLIVSLGAATGTTLVAAGAGYCFSRFRFAQARR